MHSERENFLRALEFRYPQWIPVRTRILPATWYKYRDELHLLVSDHGTVFSGPDAQVTDYESVPVAFRKGEYVRDNWGCLWYAAQHGLLGRVLEHPLADWGSLEAYVAPDPLHKTDFGEQDWQSVRKQMSEDCHYGRVTEGSGGRLFDLLYALRGYENLMVDFASGAPQLPELIDLVLKQKMKLVALWSEIGVDLMSFHGDIGTQRGLMISPEHFREYIKPMYKQIFSACRRAGAHVFYSCDGNILEIVDDLIECGVTLHDPQYGAHTLQGIKDAYGGKICVAVDLDQQHILPFGTVQEVRDLVRSVVDALARPEGGLMIYAEIQPTYPLTFGIWERMPKADIGILI